MIIEIAVQDGDWLIPQRFLTRIDFDVAFVPDFIRSGNGLVIRDTIRCYRSQN